MQAYVGTSGYQYKEWAGDFYPPGVKTKDWLNYYAQKFNAVEINSSFYRLPTAFTTAKWHAQTPAEFRFVLKGSYLTHRKRLREPQEPIQRLMRVAAPLGEKLAAVLWQLPENFPRDDQRLADFLTAIIENPQAQKVYHALELRHQTWFDQAVYRILQQHHVALVINQSAKWPVVAQATTDWLYVRFHGPRELYASNYSPIQLQQWSAKIRQLCSRGPVFAFFNNDNGNYAPKNAATFAKKLAL